MGPATHEDFAHVGGRLATGLLEVSHDLAVLDRPGFWVVVVTFEGRATCARFAEVTPAPVPAAPWAGAGSWTSSIDREGYVGRVGEIRDHIAAGEVYQVNLCRVLRAATSASDLSGLASLLARDHPSRYPALVCLPSASLHVCSASPELFLARRGDLLETRPIKGTGATPSEITAKDHAENLMIVDMARNDLGRIAATGSVEAPRLCEHEDYPGLVQLVSTVRARVRPDVTWPGIFAATFPPASVSGAPKSRALRLIEALEPSPRGPYCGAIGYVNSAAREAVLAVGIRTFWLDGDELAFGTGAGVTWGSRAEGEWDETELKARRLVGLASSPAPLGDQDSSALTSRSRSMKSHSLPGGTSR